MLSQDNDYIAREKIRTDIRSNFFVEAGAGSGKTTVLVDRMVSMVEGGIDISRICAITFTKAAAGEFYARFQEALSKSGSENAKNALVPGSAFGSEGEGYLRISYATSMDQLVEACKRIRKAVEDLRAGK